MKTLLIIITIVIPLILGVIGLIDSLRRNYKGRRLVILGAILFILSSIFQIIKILNENKKIEKHISINNCELNKEDSLNFIQGYKNSYDYIKIKNNSNQRYLFELFETCLYNKIKSKSSCPKSFLYAKNNEDDYKNTNLTKKYCLECSVELKPTIDSVVHLSQKNFLNK